MRLDPIVIVPHDPAWAASFEEERRVVERHLAVVLTRPVEHMGSTAVPGLGAKPIIDMLAVVADIDGVDAALASLATTHWCAAPEPYDAAERRRSMCAPSVERRTHHLHVVEERSVDWRGWLAFRDLLRGRPDLVLEYAALKRALAEAHGADPNDRDAYRAGKDGFISRHTIEATGPA